MGVCYYNGQGVAQDYKKAVEWFSKAAEQGYASAQFNLGVCYEFGKGVPKDDKKAVEWFSKAAEQGYASAQKKLDKFLSNQAQSQTYSQGLAYTVNADGKTCSVTGQGICKDREIVIPKTIDGYRVTSIITKTRDSDGFLTSGFDEAIKSVTIPDSVTSIGNSAFDGCTSLASVSIPDSVTSIGEDAFFCCKSLASVNIPDSVTSIGESAFRDCKSLASVNIPDSVTSIGVGAFQSCESLASMSISDSVTTIYSYAFRGCKSLASIRYDGTKKQWKKISLGIDWKKDSAIRKIECTDGDIKFLF